MRDYFDGAEAEAAKGDVATWVGELYLEYHRGVLTSQGRTKRLHRQAERDLVAAEVLASAVAPARRRRRRRRWSRSGAP